MNIITNPGMSILLNPTQWHKGIQIGTACLGTLAGLYKFRTWRNQLRTNRLRKHWENVDKDTVVLHQFWRGKTCPNLSPFALKLETFLRIAEIKYVIDEKVPQGPMRSKCPWISLNGVDTEDSELIKDRLFSEFDIKMDDHLSEVEKANLEAARIMVDEYIFWCVITYRYGFDKCRTFMTTQTFPWPMNRLFPLFMPHGIMIKAGHQGMAVFSPDEVFQIFKKCCKTLSVILGTKKFFAGEKPGSADCSIFGGLAQIMWNAPGSNYESVLTESYPNLSEYCIRMKEKIYPDWNQLLNPPLDN